MQDHNEILKIYKFNLKQEIQSIQNQILLGQKPDLNLLLENFPELANNTSFNIEFIKTMNVDNFVDQFVLNNQSLIKQQYIDSEEKFKTVKDYLKKKYSDEIFNELLKFDSLDLIFSEKDDISLFINNKLDNFLQSKENFAKEKISFHLGYVAKIISEYFSAKNISDDSLDNFVRKKMEKFFKKHKDSLNENNYSSKLFQKTVEREIEDQIELYHEKYQPDRVLKKFHKNYLTRILKRDQSLYTFAKSEVLNFLIDKKNAIDDDLISDFNNATYDRSLELIANHIYNHPEILNSLIKNSSLDESYKPKLQRLQKIHNINGIQTSNDEIMPVLKILSDEKKPNLLKLDHWHQQTSNFFERHFKLYKFWRSEEMKEIDNAIKKYESIKGTGEQKHLGLIDLIEKIDKWQAKYGDTHQTKTKHVEKLSDHVVEEFDKVLQERRSTGLTH